MRRWDVIRRVWQILGFGLLLSLSAGVCAAEAEGEILWSRPLALALPVGGTIETVAVEVGERVPEGKRLLWLSQESFRADIAAAEAELKRVTIDFGEGQREWERSQDLYERTLLSQHDLVEAESAFAAAKSALLQAKARLAHAKRRRQESELVAPYSALVIAREAEGGMPVVVGSDYRPLLTLVEAQRRRVRLWIEEGELANYQTGAAIRLKVADATYSAVIDRIGLLSRGGGGQRRFSLEGVIAEGAGLVAGQRARLLP